MTERTGEAVAGRSSHIAVAAATRALFDASPNAMTIISQAGALIAVNAAFKAVFGEAIAVSPGAGVENLFLKPNDAAHMLQALSASAAPAEAMATLRRADGEPFVAAIHAHVAPSISATGTSLLLTIRDLDADDLDTGRGDLANQERRDAIERLASGIAHDFRNVLAVIKGNLELAERRCSDPRVSALLVEADQAAALGAAMTDHLVALSQRRAPAIRSLDAGTALAGITPLLRAAAGEGTDVTIAVARDLGTIDADATEFQRALVNLITNARDAAAERGRVLITAVVVEISSMTQILSGALAPGRYVRIAVQDEGAGMSASVRRRALDAFFTTKAPGQGSGLGLALVRSFAVAAGGGLDLESTSHRGTTATLYLKSC